VRASLLTCLTSLRITDTSLRRLQARGQWVTPQFTLNTASGWQAFGFASNLTEPRHLVFDTLGQLLVVERDTGITAFTLNPDGSAASRSVLLSLTDLNTAIAISEDGSVLFASSANNAWGWDYDASTLTLTNQRLLVTGMNNSDHVTRTILRSKAHPELLVIARGSASNLDYASANITSGPAQVRVFDWTSVPAGGHTWLDGAVLSYGTRNEVGLDEDGAGHVWGVENSADNLVRVVNGTVSPYQTSDNFPYSLDLLRRPPMSIKITQQKSCITVSSHNYVALWRD